MGGATFLSLFFLVFASFALDDAPTFFFYFFFVEVWFTINVGACKLLDLCSVKLGSSDSKIWSLLGVILWKIQILKDGWSILTTNTKSIETQSWFWKKNKEDYNTYVEIWTVESSENQITLNRITNLVVGEIRGEISGMRKVGLVSFKIKYPK